MPVRHELFDHTGRRARVLVEGTSVAGAASVRRNGRDQAGHILPSGMLILRLTARGRTLTRRVVNLE